MNPLAGTPFALWITGMMIWTEMLAKAAQTGERR